MSAQTLPAPGQLPLVPTDTSQVTAGRRARAGKRLSLARVPACLRVLARGSLVSGAVAGGDTGVDAGGQEGGVLFLVSQLGFRPGQGCVHPRGRNAT